jgi:mono/diheme cytochrome c family protein
MNSVASAAWLAVTISLIGTSTLVGDDSGGTAQIERGRYLIAITGCNDCHTAGYAEREGEVPESQWLQGDTLGWKGPWGTTYAPNLRLSLSRMTADEWVFYARSLRARPPMPSVQLHNMHEEDLRAIYAFVGQLGPLGDPAPSYLPPGQEPTTPYVLFPSPPADEKMD